MNIKQLILTWCFIFFCIDVTIGFTQTSSTGTQSRGGSLRTSFRDIDKDDISRGGQTRDFIISIIGNMLRHPDKRIRLQALQSISGIFGQQTTTTSTTSDESIGGIFRIGTTDIDKDSKRNRGSGFGVITIISDLYTFLTDPEQEIRELSVVTIDNIFGSEVSLFNYLNDNDPLIRKYTMKVIVTKKMKDSSGVLLEEV